jgi:hypothetical protein
LLSLARDCTAATPLLCAQTRNAYLLVYERCSLPSDGAADLGEDDAAPVEGAAVAAGGTSKKHSLSPSISNQILSDNQQLVFDQQIYSPMFMRFVYNVLSAVTVQCTQPNIPSSTDLQYLRSQSVLQWAISFTLQVLAHFQDNSLLGDYINCIIRVCKLSPPACSWLVDLCASDPSFALSVVVTASDKTVRTHVARLLVEAIDVVIQLEQAHVLEAEEVMLPSGAVTTQPRSSVSRLLLTLFSLVPGWCCSFPCFVHARLHSEA